MPTLKQETDFSPTTNFSRYLKSIKDMPMLKDGEEFELAEKIAQKDDSKARQKLIESHLRLVAKIANQYKGYGLPMGEMISEGNIGLIQAVNRYDPEKGFKLATYAMWWIRASIQEYILRSWSMVKIGTTTSQKKLFFNLRRIKNQLKIFDDRELNPKETKNISNKLDVSEKDVTSMNRRMTGQDHSLNAPISTNGEAQGQWQDWIVDDKKSQEELLIKSQIYKKRRLLLLKSIHVLNERERYILMKRRLQEKAETLESLSLKFGVSKERIRQIEVRAIQKLQKAVKDKIKKTS
jgi:RNA polymerase sigma-32 factor